MYCSKRCSQNSQYHRTKTLKIHKTKPCLHCKKSFAPVNSFQKYCSTKCGFSARNARNEKLIKKYHPPIGKCKNCEKNFPKVAANMKFCSKKCRVESLEQRREGGVYISAKQQAQQIPEEMRTEQEHYFYSLIRPTPKRIKRTCLRCQETFSSDYGARICSRCAESNRQYGVKASMAF